MHGLNREAVALQQSEVNNFSTFITLEMDCRGLKHSPWTPEDSTALILLSILSISLTYSHINADTHSALLTINLVSFKVWLDGVIVQ